MRDLDINQPPSGVEEEFLMGAVDDDDDATAAAHRPKKLRLTKEQSRLLEESFRQNQTLNPVRRHLLFLFPFLVFFLPLLSDPICASAFCLLAGSGRRCRSRRRPWRSI